MVWEYKTAINNVPSNNKTLKARENSVKEIDQFLALMGQNNWELIQVNSILDKGITIQFVYFFKRPHINNSPKFPEIGYDIDNNGITGSQQ